MDTVREFILGGSKITADDDYSHEIKRRLLLGRKVMTYLDSLFQSQRKAMPKNAQTTTLLHSSHMLVK